MSARAARPEMVVRLEALISGMAFESAATAALNMAERVDSRTNAAAHDCQHATTAREMLLVRLTSASLLSSGDASMIAFRRGSRPVGRVLVEARRNALLAGLRVASMDLTLHLTR